MTSFSTPEVPDGDQAAAPPKGRAVAARASGLMGLNILLLFAFAFTPLAIVNDYLFSIPIVGILVYGALLTGGELLAEKGVHTGDPGLALLGVGLLQVGFATFGAGIIDLLPVDLQVLALGITAVITFGLTALVAAFVYWRSDTSFEDWSMYANVLFIGGTVLGFIGSFATPLLIVTFLCFLLGFFFRLGWEVWRVRERGDLPVNLHAIGVYVSMMGVFVHILQLVVRALARE